MSSSPTVDTATVTAEGPVQNTQAEPKLLLPTDQNCSVQPEIVPSSEKTASAEANVVTVVDQNTSTDTNPATVVDPNLSIEPSKVTLSDSSNCDKDEPDKREIQKLEENKHKAVQNAANTEFLPEVGNVPESKTEGSCEAKNPGQEPASGSIAKSDEVNKNLNPVEKTIDVEPAPQLVSVNNQNEPDQQVAREQNENIYASESINVQELTDHVMNILNDDAVEDALTEQQLLKRNVDLQQFIIKLIHLLKEKTDLCANLDRQNSALISQAKSLKDVIAITKDLLGIRNMEIEHLHADMTAMEETIKEERIRNTKSIEHLNEAMSLNDKLKNEYLTQMDLFQKLRDKYNEKVVHLTRENQRLNSLQNPDSQMVEAIPEGISSNVDLNQTESVDK